VVTPFTLLGYCDDPTLQWRAAKSYVEHALPLPSASLPIRPPRRHGKPRIAYLSGDFHQHATSYLIAELIECHDRTQFDVVGISYGPDDRSEMRARLRKAFDRFHDVRNLSDREAASILFESEVDIAVDLKGHTQNARAGILAHRPSPIQVSYLGFPGTMGVEFIDYVIGDAIVLPFDEQPFWSEKIVHLPVCY
jgi:protein O-GlcNAc transferase